MDGIFHSFAFQASVNVTLYPLVLDKKVDDENWWIDEHKVEFVQSIN